MKRQCRNDQRSQRLLIVDPVVHSRNSMVSFLRLQGSLEVVAETACAAEAIELTRQQRPDVIIMDTNPPDMDAFTATRRLLEVDEPPLVILLAIHPNAGERRRASRAGAVAYIGRSAGVDEILDTLQRLSNTITESQSVKK